MSWDTDRANRANRAETTTPPLSLLFAWCPPTPVCPRPAFLLERLEIKRPLDPNVHANFDCNPPAGAESAVADEHVFLEQNTSADRETHRIVALIRDFVPAIAVLER